MRELKKKVQQENKELTESDRDFLGNTLIPIAEKNRAETKKINLKDGYLFYVVVCVVSSRLLYVQLL